MRYNSFLKSTDATMAMRLKLLRKHKGWTLDQLAEKSGLTKSYLSKVERGLSVPSIAVALKLSHAMQVDVEQLFSDSYQQAAVTITRAGDPGSAGAMPPLPHFASIAAGVAPKKMLPFMVYPAPDFVASAFKEHAGEEFLFVHQGTIEIEFPQETVQLQTGDSVYFNALIPHRTRSIGAQQAQLLVIVSNDEDAAP